MPGLAQAEIERRQAALAVHYPSLVSEQEQALQEFRDARDAIVDAVASMLRAGLTVDDLLDECGVPRGGMRSAVRAMVGRYKPEDLIAAIEAQKGDDECRD